MAKHLTFGGSTMNRTLHCPAWVNLSKDIPPPPASDFAMDGTRKHEAMEYIYKETNATGEDLNDYRDSLESMIGTSMESSHVSVEDFDNAIYPAWVAMEELLNEYGVDNLLVEPFVELIPDVAGGSIDMLALSEDGTKLIIADYKFGHRTVHAEENAQMMFYALCALSDPKLKKFVGKKVEHVIMAIIQPNGDGNDIDVWGADIERLNDFKEQALAAIEVSQQGADTPNAGSHCRYCPAHAVCPAKTGVAQQALRLPTAQVEALNEALGLIPELEDWIKAVRKTAYEALERGVQLEGYKLVNKRPSRVWADEQEIIKALAKEKNVLISDAYERKLKSPAQMEKLFKQIGVDPEKLSDYIVSVSSGTTIAPVSDKRPDATPTLALQALADRLA